MKLSDIVKLTNELINTDFVVNSKTINIGKLGYTFEWMNSKRVFGRCVYTTKKIQLSKFIVEHNLDKIDKIKDTILHEIAHAISKEMFNKRGHGRYWKYTAKCIGANPKRCYDGSTIDRPSPYMFKCHTCGHESPRFRKPKYTHLSCGKCSPGIFDERYILEFIVNK